VLAALARADGYVSGQELAVRLGVSRAAVWKAVKELQQSGEQITSDPKRGYRLDITGQLRPSTLLRALPELAQVECHEVISSTNDRARELALRGAPSWTVVVADRQSAGRGRFTRPFISPGGCGLYFTILLRPACPSERIPYLTTCAAVAVSEAIESLCPVKVGIKWVNDLWVNGKKICGILTEGALDAESGSLAYALVGIGINVLHTDFPPELAGIATTIEDAGGGHPDRSALLCAVLRSLYTRFSDFESGTFLADYRMRSVLDGRRVTVCRGGEVFEATVQGIGEQGELCLTVGGREVRLSSGEVVSVHPERKENGAEPKNTEEP
jgi:BirA family biotin operon repressor/biotin-[acetyl-CoA-carboxylase] ligase